MSPGNHLLGIQRARQECWSRALHGRIGDAYDNAMMEAFWARMQTELLNRQRWRTRLELANAIFEYLEIFHNKKASSLSARDAHPYRI